MKQGVVKHLVVLTVGLALAAGCGKSGGRDVKTVDVSGTVYLNGQPAEGITVYFEKTTDHVGSGTTGADGKYQLTQGAEPGENKVYFSTREGGEAGSGTGAEEDIAGADAAGLDEAGGAGQVPGERLPAKYTDPLNPEITFNVPEAGTTTADFKLTSP